MTRGELRSLVSAVVGEELRRQLPAVLGEMYVRRLVEEAVGRTRPTMPAVVERVAPAPRPSAHPPSGLPAWMFEGTAPIGDPESAVVPQGATERAFGADGVPLEAFGASASSWGAVASGRHAAPLGGDLPIDEGKMRELERRRRLLEVKVG